MNKIVSSPEQAVADIADGATVAIAGFGVAHRFATSLICALRDQRTKELTLAAGQFVALNPGASFFDSVTSFEMARGGRIDTVILGAYEVDQHGSVANWSTADAKRGGIGGAMDLLSGKGDLIIVMEHVDSKGRPKLRRECTYPLTGKACVSYVVTDLALLRWDGNRFVLEEVASGYTPQEVMALTEMDVAVAPNVRTME
jgi:3-oxoacid CoA-transferase